MGKRRQLVSKLGQSQCLYELPSLDIGLLSPVLTGGDDPDKVLVIWSNQAKEKLQYSESQSTRRIS